MSKLIGVCLAKAQSEFSREFIRNLNIRARINDAKILVYNSICDFTDNSNNKGARSVYYNIPYDKLSALVILHDSICEQSLVDRIIRDSKEANVPVIMARKYDPRCFSVIGEYIDEYTSMLSKIIKEKDIKDTVFIAGRRKPEIDYDSKLRIQCYKNALEDNGLKFSLDNLYFGDYWEVPAIKIVNSFLHGERKMPEAIFCANDSMAIAIMKFLTGSGIRIPEDVMVTGFDGLEGYIFSKPKLTTCKERMDVLCENIFNIIELTSRDKYVQPTAYYYGYEAIFSESCGYEDTTGDNWNMSRELFDGVRYNFIDEEFTQNWYRKMIEKPSLERFYDIIPETVNNNFCVAITPIEIAKVMMHMYHALEDNLILFSMDTSTGLPKADRFLTKYLTPDFEQWITDDSVCYITSLFVDDNCYGVIYDRCFDPGTFGYAANRHATALNNALLSCIKATK